MTGWRPSDESARMDFRAAADLATADLQAEGRGVMSLAVAELRLVGAAETIRHSVKSRPTDIVPKPMELAEAERANKIALTKQSKTEAKTKLRNERRKHKAMQLCTKRCD